VLAIGGQHQDVEPLDGDVIAGSSDDVLSSLPRLQVGIVEVVIEPQDMSLLPRLV
jgi:hypothetical protein